MAHTSEEYNIALQIKDLLSHLSKDTKHQLIRELSQEDYRNASHTMDKENEIREQRYASGMTCVHCKGSHIVRNGHRKDGTQRYVCRDCGKSFVITTNSIFDNTRKDLDTWKKYIECMINKFSVRKCASICGLSVKTSFIWRHKILDDLQSMADSVYLSGITEADETFFPISYKGNFKKSDFVLPRTAHKRGKHHEYDMVKQKDGSVKKVEKKNKRGLSTNLVCVPCAINRNGYSIAKISNLGKVSTDALEKVYGIRIRENTTVCTDKEKSYVKFAADRNLQLVQVECKTKKGIYHTNGINSYHNVLKKFIDDFYGVSTKYLNNYLIWHNIINFSRGTEIDKQKDILAWIMKSGFRETSRNVRIKPRIPVLV